ncbi:MAG: SMC-Scp complex subunit ScpB [Ruminiclostridium sp.]|nr:SMC-Scp complex subunit ScpB [Ruminiclostridium sp.]
MNYAEGIAAVEAVMFAYGDPISPEKLAEATGLDEETAVKLVDHLERQYNVRESGLTILRINNGFQIAARREFSDNIKKALETKRQQPLSQAAMEVLAIVAYNQPVTKSFVEQVRGIDSSSVVNSLCERGLLEEAGRLDLPGRPISYRTTDTFLRCFGLSRIAELPPLPDQDGQLDFDELAELEKERELGYPDSSDTGDAGYDGSGISDEETNNDDEE